MKTAFNIALKEHPLDEGLDLAETIDLFDMLWGNYGIPIEIQAQNSTAMGFIDTATAALLNYEYDDVFTYIRRILEDMDLEEECGEYTYSAADEKIDIYIGR